MIILIYWCSWLQIPPRLFKFQSLLLLSILLFALWWFLKEKVNRALWGVSYSISHLLLFRHSVMYDSSQSHELQHTRLPYPSLSPRVFSNSCPLSRWCHATISFSVLFSSHLQSFPASGSLQMSQFFASGSQSIGVSAFAWVLPMNIQDWFPLGLTGWIALQSKGLSRAFSSTTVQKH